MSPAVRLVVSFGSLLLTFGALLYGSAGRFDVPAFHAYLALWAIQITVTQAIALRVHPDLVEERMRPPSDRDRRTPFISAVPAVAHLVLAGLDARFGWSGMPPSIQLGAFLVMAVGLGFVTWTLTTNRYASSAVRIQHDRGQVVITHGPYALVRHPMYLGVFLVVVSAGLALGSWWSALAILPLVPIFVVRTQKEDRMLHEELAGYPAYASRVQWKVIPLVF